MTATLILENGSIFQGESIGDMSERICQLVFNTSMAGYQELLTDPSYAGQGVVMTYPLVGNYGVNEEDHESGRPWAEAFIVRHLSERGSNFRCEGDLDSYLKKFHITGIQNVDTRAITRLLRSQGTMNAMITCAEHFSVQEALERIRAYRIQGAVERVTRSAVEVLPAQGEDLYRVAVLDLGVKESMLHSLQQRGCTVTVYPAFTTAQEILSGGFDGVFLSNGPGDPEEHPALIETARALYQSQLPIFAAGLGHQLLALATGAKIEKLPFGHHGASYPVRDLARGKMRITAQNHNYTVNAASVDPTVAEISYRSISDDSVEGLSYHRANCFSVQFEPEPSLSPMGTEYLFDQFVASMQKGGVQ